MKYSIAAVAGFVSAISAAVLPEAFTLVADGGYNLLTDGQHAVFGGNTSNTNPILILRSGGGTGVSYTALDGTPTAFQNLYVVQNDVQPIGLTLPHSGATPAGANMTGFGVNDKGYFTFNGSPSFAVDPSAGPVKTIYWLGLGHSKYQQSLLWVKECKGC